MSLSVAPVIPCRVNFEFALMLLLGERSLMPMLHGIVEGYNPWPSGVALNLAIAFLVPSELVIFLYFLGVCAFLGFV